MNSVDRIGNRTETWLRQMCHALMTLKHGINCQIISCKNLHWVLQHLIILLGEIYYVLYYWLLNKLLHGDECCNLKRDSCNKPTCPALITSPSDSEQVAWMAKYVFANCDSGSSSALFFRLRHSLALNVSLSRRNSLRSFVSNFPRFFPWRHIGWIGFHKKSIFSVYWFTASPYIRCQTIPINHFQQSNAPQT